MDDSNVFKWTVQKFYMEKVDEQEIWSIFENFGKFWETYVRTSPWGAKLILHVRQTIIFIEVLKSFLGTINSCTVFWWIQSFQCSEMFENVYFQAKTVSFERKSQQMITRAVWTIGYYSITMFINIYQTKSRNDFNNSKSTKMIKNIFLRLNLKYFHKYKFILCFL